MNKVLFYISLCALCMASPSLSAQKEWTLRECLDYALEHNLQLKQDQVAVLENRVAEESATAALLPTLSFSTNQSGVWRPYSLSTVNLTNGTMTTTRGATNYSGSYGLNAGWTVWNGGKNLKNVKRSRNATEMSELQVKETANSIQQQIAQLYIQILYDAEAVKVSEETVKASEMQRDRAAERVKVGDLAKVDLLQLEAQVTQDRYTLVNTQTQLENYKLQLRQLLEIHDESVFEVARPQIDDRTVLGAIPDRSRVYMASLQTRPEIARNRLNVEASRMYVDIARASYYPTLSLSAGMGSNNASGMKGFSFGEQLKNNWSNTIGLTLSVPIFDGRSTKSSVEKARLSVLNSQLSLQSAEKKLYSEVETYHLNAVTSQQQYVYAKKNVESMAASYRLLSEQFQLGLKNIVELTTGKNNLLSARQQLLQTKYTTLYNIAMLSFYAGEPIKL